MPYLVKETQEAIECANKTEADVAYVSYYTDGLWSTWEEFYKAARNVYYDDGFGLQEILPELKIVFYDGGWLERHEYDGSEWWEYREAPSKGEHADEIPKIKYNPWGNEDDEQEEEEWE